MSLRDHSTSHNLLGIADAEELGRAEADFTRFRLWQLVKTPVRGSFDLPHLQRSHHHIFPDIYAWGGRTPYGRDREDGAVLPAAAHRVVRGGGLRRSRQARLPPGQACRAPSSSPSWRISTPTSTPCIRSRRGTGWAQRAFVGQLAREAGWDIAWARLDADRNVQASIAGFRGDEASLREMLDELISPIG